MNGKPDSPYRSPKSPEKAGGSGDELANIFGRLTDQIEARTREEAEREKLRGPLTKFLLTVTVLSALGAGAIMLYGVMYFPDAPIRQTPGGYAGKGGAARTAGEYASFKSWETALFSSVGLAFLVAAAAAISEALDRRRANASAVKRR